MSIILLYSVLKVALVRILVAGLTLLPAPLAYVIYKSAFLDRDPLPLRGPKLYIRLAIHFAVALCVVFVITYVLGQSCRANEDGDCFDEDWKAPTAHQSLVTFVRLSVLTFGGMLYALRVVGKYPPRIRSCLQSCMA